MSTADSPTMQDLLAVARDEWLAMAPHLAAMAPRMEAIGQAFLSCWRHGGKVLTCGNGGSSADAMHLAEELSVRFERNRQALPAIALCDPTVLTCAGNDFGFDRIFSRQIEALGRPGDVLCVLTTSGNSPNIVSAVTEAKARGLVTVAFLGKGGGKLAGVCDHELIVPATTSHRTQEGHSFLYHALCQWIDRQVP
jgi:D-sedoheptulose 7-phosphate isomerase